MNLQAQLIFHRLLKQQFGHKIKERHSGEVNRAKEERHTVFMKALYGSTCYQLHVDFTAPQEKFCVNICNRISVKRKFIYAYLFVNFAGTLILLDISNGYSNVYTKTLFRPAL